MNKMRLNQLILLITAIIVSVIFYFAHILLPFMFGPIIATLIVVKVFKLEVVWPFWLSQIGLILLGVQIGTTFTSEVMNDIKDDCFIIILVTVLLIGLSLLIAYFFKKIARVNTETAILSVIPGALSQMLIMAEENKKANILVVSLTQTSRVIFVVILVPFISFLFSDSANNVKNVAKVTPLTNALNLPQILFLVVVIALIYMVMSKINFPTKQLLAPIIVLVVWNLTTHITFTLDNYILASAQVIYMIRIGLQIANLLGDLKGRIAVAIIYQNVLLIVGAFVMVYIIHLFTNSSINELFLGGAPGGMSQIVLVAIATGADVAMISSFHIFRIFFILFIVAPIISFFLKMGMEKYNKK
ncbi:AbrB family transcriptional regulator [Staphylococcus devriesei]|uniref:AbrB family transcriptional regulator n=1 Tax=Staphylococcus devriesei TaxID=586733 RepID=A0ABX5I5M6_9STAP|nr:AbrB family transcriptional regulator [Staphylococcus devriesei]MCE5089887.1 AbrB family transcriptional regulator [Staphylococcus devriesei]MCE5097571.1 AbrB family transcriptional regulator [Staphylococcus devriesei]PNZ89337.1 aminopeptidase [Staphylococcus devriesei]PTF15359.1 AbrB family transcriptional regulator [Staphylococcus devriesei]PTF18136.1 AbrB family transcriptional regulator [Staphylococcus devriesei]